MLKYIIRRTLLVIPTLLAVTFIVYTLLIVTPGDPGRIILGEFASQEAVYQLNHELGADKPFIQRFADYVVGILTRFDFGNSYRTGNAVVDEIMVRFPYTLFIAFCAVTGSTLLGMPIGILMAAKRNMLVDRSVNILAMIFAAIPNFVFALSLIYVFAVQLKWLPPFGVKTWQSFILPLVTLILPSSVSRMRLARTTMLESIRQEYVTMARSKGIPENRVIFVHALKNSLIPLITSILNSFSGMLGGAMILETVFSIPGLGLYIVQGIKLKDMPTTLATTIFLAAIFCFTSLLLDIIYALVDPRIKSRYTKEAR